MNERNFIAKIKESLEKMAVPITKCAGDDSIIMGYCNIEGEPMVFNFIIRATNNYVTVYMIAPYGADVFGCDDVYKKIADVNLSLAKGHFNADTNSKRLIYKWVLPGIYFEDDCDNKTKEFVVLPAAMIIKYKEKLLSNSQS